MRNSSSQLLKKHDCPPTKRIFPTSPSKIKYWVIIFCQLSWVFESHIPLWYLRFFLIPQEPILLLWKQYDTHWEYMAMSSNNTEKISFLKQNKTKTAVFQISHTNPSFHDYRDVYNINDYTHFMYSMSHFSYLGIIKVFSQLICNPCSYLDLYHAFYWLHELYIV